MHRHLISNRLLSGRRVETLLVGCGGTGSQVLSGLARLHLALCALGHPGLRVTVLDPDRVADANLGRQLFFRSDLGLNKAAVLAHRANLSCGTDFKSLPIPVERYQGRCELVVGCVDTRGARRAIARYGEGAGAVYWIDLGNGRREGQVVLGEFGGTVRFPAQPRLPTVADLFPELMDEQAPEVDDGPSCSLAQALNHQDLFVNQVAATLGLELLWRLFRQGGLDIHGYFFELQSGTFLPLRVPRPEEGGKG